MSLPCGECKGKCCTMPAMSLRELKRITRKYGEPNGTVKMFGDLVIIHDDEGNCPYLSEGSCTVYDVRPKTCQEYGVNPRMPCQYLYPDKAKSAVDGLLNKHGVKL
jgi:Fe-S-cluster containining protein